MDQIVTLLFTKAKLKNISKSENVSCTQEGKNP